jgi:ATPase family associated with various cellular activities (AAA)
VRHLEILQALIRSALAAPSPALLRQVERLRDACAAEHDVEAVAVLERLIRSTAHNSELRPSRLRRSAAATLAPGETLSSKTGPPVDRETANPLAELIPVERLPRTCPIFEPHLAQSISDLLQEWAHVDALVAAGIPPSRTCLIYGSPGTGKTALALWMAGQLGLPVVLARLDGLISSFLGTTARNVSTLFAFAARYRCLLLLDEFDAIAKQRDDPQEVGEIKRVVNAVLQNLDQRGAAGLTIAVTNHEGLLDPAIWRRFEMQIAVPKPGFEERCAIITRYFEPAAVSTSDLHFLAWLTEGQSGADLESFVRSLRRHVAIRHADLHESIDTIVPSEIDLVDAARRYFSINRGRITQDRFRELTSPEPDFIKALLDAEFTQTDIGNVLRRSASTISRKRKTQRGKLFAGHTGAA